MFIRTLILVLQVLAVGMFLLMVSTLAIVLGQ